jgi:hypothetical protein
LLDFLRGADVALAETRLGDLVQLDFIRLFHARDVLETTANAEETTIHLFPQRALAHLALRFRHP